jgi:hypothetical protein
MSRSLVKGDPPLVKTIKSRYKLTRNSALVGYRSLLLFTSGAMNGTFAYAVQRTCSAVLLRPILK